MKIFVTSLTLLYEHDLSLNLTISDIISNLYQIKLDTNQPIEIVLLMAKLESVTLLRRELQRRHWENIPHENTIRNLFKKFKEFGSVGDSPRSGMDQRNTLKNRTQAQKLLCGWLCLAPAFTVRSCLTLTSTVITAWKSSSNVVYLDCLAVRLSRSRRFHCLQPCSSVVTLYLSSLSRRTSLDSSSSPSSVGAHFFLRISFRW